MKVNIPLCKPENVDFPEYPNKEQLNRWLWRIVQIPYPLYLITTVDENDVPNVEVNTWTMPFGFAPYQMFVFACGMAHHTAQNALSTGEFVMPSRRTSSWSTCQVTNSAIAFCALPSPILGG